MSRYSSVTHRPVVRAWILSPSRSFNSANAACRCSGRCRFAPHPPTPGRQPPTAHTPGYSSSRWPPCAEQVQSAKYSVHRPAQLLLHPADDVDDPPVGAGVEQHQPPAALQHQGVLMGEVIRNKAALLHLAQQIGLPAGKGAAVDGLRYQPRPVEELEQPLRVSKRSRCASHSSPAEPR